MMTAAMLLGAAALTLHVQAQSGRANQVSTQDPEAEFHMARMIYADNSGGRVGGSRRVGWGYRPGWWAIDYPEAEYHFTRGVRRLSRIDVADDSRHLQLTDDAIFDYPWMFVQQVGRWILSQQEVERLREYLLRGGFLVADDFHGNYEWRVFADTMRRVFPDRPIVDMDSDHDIFHTLYDLDQNTQIPGQRHVRWAGAGEPRVYMEGPQAWRGIYDDKGRLMVAINFNMDMGDAWEHADDPYYPEAMTAAAYRFGLNYVIYAMTH